MFQSYGCCVNIRASWLQPDGKNPNPMTIQAVGRQLFRWIREKLGWLGVELDDKGVSISEATPSHHPF